MPLNRLNKISLFCKEISSNQQKSSSHRQHTSDTIRVSKNRHSNINNNKNQHRQLTDLQWTLKLWTKADFSVDRDRARLPSRRLLAAPPPNFIQPNIRRKKLRRKPPPRRRIFFKPPNFFSCDHGPPTPPGNPQSVPTVKQRTVLLTT